MRYDRHGAESLIQLAVLVIFGTIAAIVTGLAAFYLYSDYVAPYIEILIGYRNSFGVPAIILTLLALASILRAHIVLAGALIGLSVGIMINFYYDDKNLENSNNTKQSSIFIAEKNIETNYIDELRQLMASEIKYERSQYTTESIENLRIEIIVDQYRSMNFDDEYLTSDIPKFGILKISNLNNNNNISHRKAILIMVLIRAGYEYSAIVHAAEQLENTFDERENLYILALANYAFNDFYNFRSIFLKLIEEGKIRDVCFWYHVNTNSDEYLFDNYDRYADFITELSENHRVRWFKNKEQFDEYEGCKGLFISWVNYQKK